MPIGSATATRSSGRNLAGPIARSIQKGHSEFVKTLIHRGASAPLLTEAGIYVGEGVAVPILWKRVRSWGRLACRGLYYAHMSKRIPDHYEFETRRVLDSRRNWAFDHMMSLGAPGPFRMGEPEEETEKVVSWTYLIDAEDQFRSIWLLWFYQSIFIEVSTGPPGSHQELDDALAAQRREAYFSH